MRTVNIHPIANDLHGAIYRKDWDKFNELMKLDVRGVKIECLRFDFDIDCELILIMINAGMIVEMQCSMEDLNNGRYEYGKGLMKMGVKVKLDCFKYRSLDYIGDLISQGFDISSSPLLGEVITLIKNKSQEEFEKRWSELSLIIVVSNPSLPWDIILEKWDELIEKSRSILTNPNIPVQFIRDNWNDITNRSGGIYWLSNNPSLDLEFILEKWNKLARGNIVAKSRLDRQFIIYNWTRLHKGRLCENPSLTPEIILENWGELASANIYSLSSNPALTPDIIRMKWEELDKKQLCNNSSLAPDLILEHWNELIEANLEALSENQALTPDIIEGKFQFLNKIHLSSNPSLPYQLVLDNPNACWNECRLSYKTYMPCYKGRMVKSARTVK